MSMPCILMIVTDHWPAHRLGRQDTKVKTPGLDELATNGTRFINCYSECRSAPAEEL